MKLFGDFKKRSLAFLLTFSMVVVAGCSSSTGSTPAQEGTGDSKEATQSANESGNYPTKTITGVIPWGAGGATDTLSRTIAPLAEKELGQSIVLTNKTGATGAIGTQYVFDKEADGYNILFNAENPTIYGVLGISKLTYDDFYPINIMARVLPTIVVAADSKYKTLEDVINDAKANPGKVKYGSAGPGSQPETVGTMLSSVTGTKYNMVPFDGEGPILTALLGGHVDVSVAGFTAAYENAKAGKVRILAVINDQRVEQLKDVPAISEVLPDMAKYMPWGPFYGVWVKKETPEDVKKKLIDAFAVAWKDPKFQDQLKQRGAVPLGLSGDEAIKYWKDWQSTTAWLLQDAGAAKVSPEELGIPKKQ